MTDCITLSFQTNICMAVVLIFSRTINYCIFFICHSNCLCRNLRAICDVHIFDCDIVSIFRNPFFFVIIIDVRRSGFIAVCMFVRWLHGRIQRVSYTIVFNGGCYIISLWFINSNLLRNSLKCLTSHQINQIDVPVISCLTIYFLICNLYTLTIVFFF